MWDVIILIAYILFGIILLVAMCRAFEEPEENDEPDKIRVIVTIECKKINDGNPTSEDDSEKLLTENKE